MIAITHKILNRDPRDTISKACCLFGGETTGETFFNTLKRVSKELGERMTDQEIPGMIDEAV